jgi:FAD/FMN-containing dehydrogenase
MVTRSKSAAIDKLRELLDADAVTTDDAALASAAWDALGTQRGFAAGAPPLPLAVVYPRTRDDLVALMRWANDTNTAVVPYGGGSGLMGGARSDRASVVVDMTRMARVREIDVVSRVAWVEAGAALKDVDDALRPHGLMIGHDPWTYAIATVGGAISTNGLGFLAGKYGSMGDQVLGIEVVMPDGSIVATPAVATRSTGIDLSRLFVAGEGQFGVIAAAALRVFPIPESRRLVGFTFATFDQGFEMILAMHATGINPALLDYGERPSAPGEPPTLYLGFDGLRQGVDAFLSRAAAICREHDGTRMNDASVEEFWTNRHTIAENFAANRAARRTAVASHDEGRCFDYMHVSLPPSRVLDYRRRALAIATERGVRVLEAGIWVSPGLFSLAMANVAPTHAEAVERMASAVDACLRAAHDAGGSIEYCHGVGVRLAHLMREEHGAGLDVMRAIKRALDPGAILNPGKLALGADD